MDTLEALTTWNARNARPVTGPADLLDRQGRGYNNDRTPVGAVALREVAARQAQMLRAAGATGRKTATETRIAAAVEAVRTTQNAPAPVARPAVAAVGDRPTYKQIDARAAEVPVGMYCLPRTRPSSTGSMVTFFKVHKFRGGHRIVQLVGSVGDYTELPLKVEAQWAALGHILDNVAGAAALYGQEAKECGFCRAQGRHSPLTHERSRAAGYGKACADRHGLPW
jgi:hypothetical protein